MGFDTGLASRIRAKGVRVVEVAGWRTRGYSTYTPRAVLWHHTAGSSRGSTPSLGVCTNGRSGLPGPLCQVLQSREPDGNDIAYVVAAGKANHGGNGYWKGVSGNSNTGGLEVEHIGLSTQSARRHEISARILAAMLEGGPNRSGSYCCRHAEYATPRGRKIDFNIAAAPWTADGMRSRVGYWIGRTASGVAVPFVPQGDEFDMASIADLERALDKKLGAMRNQLAAVHADTVGNSGRLHEVTVATRHLLNGGFFATREATEGVVYFIFANHSGRIKMNIDDAMHKWLKSLHALNHTSSQPVDMTRSVIDRIPVISSPPAG